MVLSDLFLALYLSQLSFLPTFSLVRTSVLRYEFQLVGVRILDIKRRYSQAREIKHRYSTSDICFLNSDICSSYFSI